jgi:hypothetical protein
VLAIRQGATENATAAKGLLEDLVERGVQPDPAQRYRARKLRNVMDHLPQDQNG